MSMRLRERYRRTLALLIVSALGVLNLGLSTIPNQLAGNLANIDLAQKHVTATNPIYERISLNFSHTNRATGGLYREIILGFIEHRYGDVYALLRLDGLGAGRRRMIARKLGFAFFEKGLLSEAVKSWELMESEEIDRIKKRLLDLARREESRDLACTERSYRALIVLEPVSRTRYEIIGDFFLRNGRRNDAIEMFELGRKKTEGADSLYLAGRAAEERGDWQVAASFYRQTFELNGDFILANYRHAQVLAYRLGARSKAIDICKEIVRIAPNFYSVYQLLGWLYSVQGEEQKAIHWLKTGFEIVQGDNYRSILGGQLGHLFLESGNFEKAVYYLERAIELEIYNADAHYDLARIYSARGDLQISAASYQEALRRAAARGRGMPGWHRELGQLYERMGDKVRASQAYQAVELNPKD